jgi:hypothetical protein
MNSTTDPASILTDIKPGKAYRESFGLSPILAKKSSLKSSTLFGLWKVHLSQQTLCKRPGNWRFTQLCFKKILTTSSAVMKKMDGRKTEAKEYKESIYARTRWQGYH